MSSRKYVLAYLLLLSPLSLVIFANYLFLRSSGELLAAPRIAELQVAGGSNAAQLYGTATNHNTYRYKLELYRKLRPTIVAVGSSRVMQFRESFFDVPFVTMGGAMNSLREGEMLLEDMLRIHRPEVILLGLDFWWFDASVPEASDDHSLLGSELSPGKLLFPVDSLRNGKISPGYFFDSIERSLQPCANCQLGLNAAVNGEGFARDGSYYYVGTVTGRRASLDYRFSRTSQQVQGVGAERRWTMPATADSQRLQRLQHLLQLAHDRNVRVVVFLPPIAPTLIGIMKSHGASMDLGRQIGSALPADVAFLDFSDPSSVGSAGDCEFIDGGHGGDLLYLRILQALGKSAPDAVGRYLNANKLRAADELSGLAMIPDAQVAPGGEIDFLGLGCGKHAG